jgi:phosphatidylglycerophosphatase A
VTVRLGWRTLLDPVHFVALGFGAGLAPRAPGTFGTAVALLPAWWCFGLPLSLRIAIVAAVILAGIWICGESARRLGVHDHGGIVFDEIAGLLLTSLALPENTFAWLFLAFVLFRIFDIWKPWPIREVDHRLGGGAGIMLDDLMAAVYAAVCLVGLRAFLPTT